MDNDYKMKKPKDQTLINWKDVGELLWWSQQLGTSPEKILTTIEEVGNAVEDVKKNIK